MSRSRARHEERPSLSLSLSHTRATSRARTGGASRAGVVAGLLAGVLAGAVAPGLSGCAHQGPPAPSGPVQRWQETATRVPGVAFEDEFVEARLVFQALPLSAPQRLPLRANLLRYLLAPLAPLNADRLRREAAELGSTDVFDRVFDSLRDAVSLFDPSELARMASEAALPPASANAFGAWERQALGQAARLTLALFSPRGAETQSALALAVLMTVEPQSREWPQRFERLLTWSDDVRTTSERGQPPSPTAIDLLQVVLSDWPAPFVADRLATLYKSRQKQFFSILKPLPTDEDARQSLRDLLLAHGQEMQRTVPNVVAPYLRCGRIAEAALAATSLRDSPGDDPELRAMLAAATRPSPDRDAFLRLARRFLPRIELLQGTATDNPDLLVAFRVLEVGLARSPGDAELLLLSAELAKLMSSPFLAIRQLEEAEAVLVGQQPRTPAIEARLAQISEDLLELYFLRLRLSLDPERGTPPSADEVARVRQRSALVSQRAPKADPGELRIRDAQIDFELARSYMNAGLVDQAEPLFLRAQSSNPAVNPEITAEFGNFLLKRGNTQQAGKVLRDGLAALRGSAHANDTITGVEGQSKIERLLGEALDREGDRSGAEEAWRSSATGWGQLTMEYRRRANTSRESEARFEVGRTLYLLGRHAEGIQSFDEAIEQDGDRDQTYIDSIAFLVEQGEVEAALGIYRRALAKPDRSVSEYVKVYASLWIVDLTRRILKQADVTALAFLNSLDARHPELRPQRGSRWYRQLAAFAVGRISYAQLLAEADTNGKRAEVYFYQAMRQLADGKSEQAQSLWQKVIDTRMVSFFEFEMASRYLRGGAPSNAPAPTFGPTGAPSPMNTETI
jgi:tetratricopeptide (TPR) repeat protein